jgi:hypothetical protein
MQLLWRPTGRWITWGSTTVVSAGAGVKGSRQYTASLGPLMLGLMLPLSRRELAEQSRRLQPALRRVANRRRP